MADPGTLGWLEALQRELAPSAPPPDPEKQKEAAAAHLEVGALAAKATALHLSVGQKGYEVLQAKVHKVSQQVKTGDLSAIEQALVEQFFMMHGMATHYATAAGELGKASGKMAPALVEMTTKCSRASRQLAQTIADLKQPRKTQFIKAQQNNLYVEPSHAQEMDTGAATTPAGSDTDLATVEAQQRPQDASGKGKGSPERA